MTTPPAGEKTTMSVAISKASCLSQLEIWKWAGLLPLLVLTHIAGTVTQSVFWVSFGLGATLVSLSHIKLAQTLSQVLQLDNIYVIYVLHDDDDDDDCVSKCQGVAAQSCFYKNSTLCIRNEWVAYEDDH